MAELQRLRTGQRGDSRSRGMATSSRGGLLGGGGGGGGASAAYFGGGEAGGSSALVSTQRLGSTAGGGGGGRRRSRSHSRSSRPATGATTTAAAASSSSSSSSMAAASSHPEAGPSTRAFLQKVKQMRTGFVLGNDDPVACDVWTSAARREAAQAGSAVYVRAPYINKNESRVVLGTFKPPGGRAAHFSTVMKSEIVNTVGTAGYERAVPPPGFDRATANRTNYDLGVERICYESNAMRSNNDPAGRAPVRQPSYRVVGVDDGMRTFEGGRRCNGLQGLGRADFGVSYDIVTGAEDGAARSRQRTGPRLSVNRLNNEQARGQARETRYDPVFGRDAPVAAPPTLL
jgi:hypothetical protein